MTELSNTDKERAHDILKTPRVSRWERFDELVEIFKKHYKGAYPHGKRGVTQEEQALAAATAAFTIG